MCVLIICWRTFSSLFPFFALPKEIRFFSAIFRRMWTITAAKQPTRWMILWRSYDVDLFVELIQFNSFQFMWIFILFIILSQKKPKRCNCAMVFFHNFFIKYSLHWIDVQRTTIILFELNTKKKQFGFLFHVMQFITQCRFFFLDNNLTLHEETEEIKYELWTELLPNQLTDCRRTAGVLLSNIYIAACCYMWYANTVSCRLCTCVNFWYKKFEIQSNSTEKKEQIFTEMNNEMAKSLKLNGNTHNTQSDAVSNFG